MDLYGFKIEKNFQENMDAIIWKISSEGRIKAMKQKEGEMSRKKA